MTDADAIGALRALHDDSRRVPEDVQLIGWDDIAEAEFTEPRLSSVDPDSDAIADAIVRMLLDQMLGTVSEAARVIVPAAKLALPGPRGRWVRPTRQRPSQPPSTGSMMPET